MSLPPSIAPRRSAIAVHALPLSDGTVRFSVRIMVGRTPLVAGLDTGSTGLRVLAGALRPSDVRDRSETATRYGFASGTVLRGRPARCRLTIGGIAGTTVLQLVEAVGCAKTKPRCPAGRVAADRFGIQGNGLPDEGFAAILGINMAETGVGNPLVALGIGRWLLDLPRIAARDKGWLILNPADHEVAGHVMLPLLAAGRMLRSGLHDAVAGRLVNEGSGIDVRGAVLLDCGAPGIVAASEDGGEPWPHGTPARLVLGEEGEADRAAVSFTVGRRSHAASLRFRRTAEGAAPAIIAGVMPYLAFSVLHDPAARLLGVRPRDAPAGGPLGGIYPEGRGTSVVVDGEKRSDTA